MHSLAEVLMQTLAGVLQLLVCLAKAEAHKIPGRILAHVKRADLQPARIAPLRLCLQATHRSAADSAHACP